MSSADNILDYLTKRLVVEQTLVTFRSLSRDLEIHVNQAKNELAKYHAEHQFREVAYATYWISGETNMKTDDGMDIDENVEEERITETTVMLVEESDLEEAKGSFVNINTIHIYSLSPAVLRESALVCEPTIHLRKVETEKGQKLAKKIGRISGPHVKRRAAISQTKSLGPNAASTSKAKAPRLAKPAPPAKEPTSAKEPNNDKKEAPKEEAKPESKEEKPKVKASGKIDFGKAKPKESKAEEKSKAAPKPAVAESSSKVNKDEGKKEEIKRGVKRKNTIQVSDTESENYEKKKSPTPPAAPMKFGPPKRKPNTQKAVVRPKKGVIISDDEDSDVPIEPKVQGKAKAAVVESDSDSELRAMMDLDDDQVIKASRSASEARKEVQDEDVEMADVQEPEPVAKPKAKKASKKKVVPVGSNGLKKKRVNKSRQTMDDKGYFVTEDYSSYESVDEEEPEPEAPTKGKGKRKSTATRNGDGDSKTGSKPPSDTSEPKAKPKKAGSGAKATGQMDLKSWFAKPKK